jgi:hypothetical protein
MWLLVASACCNVAFLSYSFFQWEEGTLWLEVAPAEQPSVSGPPIHDSSLEQSLISFLAKKDEELIQELDNIQVVAHGYRAQELALAILHQREFQIEDPLRQVGAWPQPLCACIPAQGMPSVMLFSKLDQTQIQTVKKFLDATELPFTAKGLVQRMVLQDSEDLKQALIRTDEWAIFRQLFPSASDEKLLATARQFGPEVFATIVDWSKSHQDPHKLGTLLLALFPQHPSQLLAELLAARYAELILQQADDTTICELYKHLPEMSQHGRHLALRMLQGQRKPLVWQESQNFLAKTTNQPSIATMSRDQLLQQLKTSKKPTPQPAQPTTSKKSVPAYVSSRAATRQLTPYRIYVVRKGDTLWSIAKKFNINVEKLKYLNGLRGNQIPPGRELKIPH